MKDLRSRAQHLLTEAGLDVLLLDTAGLEAVAFEGETSLGFVLVYSDPSAMIERWSADMQVLLTEHQFALRRATEKAWNTYLICLSVVAPTLGQRVALAGIEENLVGTRKIARAGIDDIERLRFALLPLLPIQNAPQLSAVDMKAEIQLRSSELEAEALEALFSSAAESSVAQMLEEIP